MRQPVQTTLFDKVADPPVVAAAGGRHRQAGRVNSRFDFLQVLHQQPAVNFKAVKTHRFDVAEFFQNIFREEGLILRCDFHCDFIRELKGDAHFDAQFRVLIDILHVAFRALREGDHRVY